MQEFLNNPAALLFLILALGVLIGQIKVAGISLGSSTVLFVAMLFGHFGYDLPGAIGTLGVVLFVYAVGLQAGPRFFKSFKKRGLSFAFLASCTLAAGFITTVVVFLVFDLDAAIATGLYTGALTTTPGLAAASETLKDPLVSVGYGLAYPFGVVGVVLFVQLLPRIIGIDLKDEARQAAEREKPPRVERVWLDVTNPQIIGKTVAEILRAQQSGVVVARILRDGAVMPASEDSVIQEGDRIRFVGTEEELGNLELLCGPKAASFSEPPSPVTSRTLVITEPEVVGKSLGELCLRERYGVVVTRLFRDDFEFVPKATTRLDMGDTIRIVGEEHDCEKVTAAFGDHEERLNETNLLPLTIGLFLGVAVGTLSLPIPGGVSLSLGMAGGPLLVALLIGHIGRVGSASFRVPVAARIFVREIGLLFFLASAGISAGGNFWEVASQQGAALLLSGFFVTIVPLATAFAIARYVMKLDAASTMGALCGGMTSTPGLGVATSAADSDVPALSYATVYPVALIFVTILSQILGLLLLHFGAN